MGSNSSFKMLGDIVQANLSCRVGDRLQGLAISNGLAAEPACMKDTASQAVDNLVGHRSQPEAYPDSA